MVSVTPVKPDHIRLQLLDTSRFLAAASVVVYHWFFSGIRSGFISDLSYTGFSTVASYGYLGVYLFFMISGFVIAASAQSGSASRFAVGRLVRLYPAFWVAVLFTTIVTALWGAPTFTVTGLQVLGNMTMVPGALGQPLVDASYWTLFHELVFYAVVFIVLLMGQGRRLDALYPGWAMTMAVVTLLAPGLSTKPLLGTIYGFFAAGAILSSVQRRGWNWWRACGVLASVYVVMSYVVADVPRMNEGPRPHEQSLIVTIVIVTLFYALLIIQINPGVSRWKIPGSNLLGRLTYPVYLLHTYFGFILLDHVATDENKWLAYPLSGLLVVGLAFSLHVLIEQRPKATWFRFFDRIAGKPIRWMEQRFRRRNLSETQEIRPGGCD